MQPVLKRTPFGLQKDSFWKAKGVHLEREDKNKRVCTLYFLRRNIEYTPSLLILYNETSAINAHDT